jgi:hypothetical protein
MFNSSCQWVDIILTEDDIQTLIDVFIADPMWADLLVQLQNLLPLMQLK